LLVLLTAGSDAAEERRAFPLGPDVKPFGNVPSPAVKISAAGISTTAELSKTVPESRPSTLRWHNGEALTGEPLAATATALTWQSPLFAEPLVVQWDALRRIDRMLEPVTATGPFTIALREGSRIFGDIVAISDTALTIRSERHGGAVLRRADILSARRIAGGDLLVGGPAGEGSWRAMADTTKNMAALGTPVPFLRAGPGGALQLPYWNRGAVLDVKIPERAEIEFRVRSERRLDFQLALGAGGTHRLRLETWDNELVLVAARSFLRLRTLTEADREVALRIFWDRAAQKCSVTTPTGEPIADWTVPADASNANEQVQLLNKGRDLSLELLRVRKWNGRPPEKLAGQQPRVEFADGRIVEGEIGAGTAGMLTLRAAGASTAHALAEVEALVFSTAPPVRGEPETTLAYADGTLLHGALEAIDGGRASLRTAFSDEPIRTQLAELRQLLRPARKADAENEARPLAKYDALVLPEATLHGTLSSTGEAQPRWLPVGGVKPVALKTAAALEIRRAISPDAPPAVAPALFYLASGDVLPGDLRGLDRKTVALESSISDVRTLSIDSLHAIQFGAPAVPSMKGFGDAGWRIKRGDESKVSKTADTAVLKPDTAIAHGAIMQSSEITFTLAVERGFGGVCLRLFSAGDDWGKTANLVLASLGSRLYYGMQEGEGNEENMQQMSIASGKSVAVRLVIDDQQVHLHINGAPVSSFSIPATKRPGTGLVIKPANVFGNEQRTITLTDFATIAGPGRTWLPEVTTEARLHALTVPRFRRDDPPRHALLAANGDVLRGEIEAATPSHFGFRSGLENLRVPRERVRAAIWLQPPDKDAPPPETPSATTKLLQQKLTRRVRYGGAGLSTLVGVLQREAPGLKVALPPQQDSRRVSMQFGGQTVAEALEEICRIFDLRHRVDGETVVLESGAPPARETATKVYWLKPGGLPAGEAARAALADRGIPFSSKAVMQWEPRTGHLTVTDIPATHEQLPALLAEHFGGAVGSPTHWLLLTSGARLALAVEKFEPEAVVGRHPVFGTCRVPVAQMHTLATTPPPATPVMKALADWRLVQAPEPVRPETGGESSPTLGKDAAAFTLPLLGGGEFNLAEAKGKVVVLDFWATWCGPCIKAVPALIETLSALPADRVVFLGVNQSEPAEQVQRFLEARGWKLTVALDAGQKVARQYGVEGIPHTVIVGPDGKVAWVKTGYSASGAEEAAAAVRKLLSGEAGVKE
jgi:thiol-disulfide isomerase/thioredoxin